jgi:large subunit ribosomal protein L33
MGNKNIVLLQCTACKEKNYSLARNKKAGGGTKKLETKKYCPRCRSHTVHKETKS